MDRVSNIKITNTFFLFASGVIRSWQRNRAQIARITFVNLLVALLGELLVRKALVSISWLPANETVFYSGKLHTQVSINLLMTFFASIFGSVVYFFESRVARYVFFISFALFNSILAQGFLALFSKLDATYFSRRLIFDFVYSASLKFGSFEFIRKPLSSRFSSYRKMILIRNAQDIFMTIIKVKALYLFGLISS